MELIKKTYGWWDSPISAKMTIFGPSNRSCDIILQNNALYWTESRPEEAGRVVILKRLLDESDMEVITPEGFNVRSKVHEYGGRAFTVEGDSIFFVNAKDQRLYRQTCGALPTPFTNQGIRYAEPLICSEGIIAVGERHDENKVSNFLSLISIENKSEEILESEHDFYAYPTLSPNGKKISWITWDHPQMPWDGTSLWVADWDCGKIKNKKLIAGGKTESILQPRWSSQGNLYFLSDRSGWWNLYKHFGESDENIFPTSSEIGFPLWALGMSSWCFTGRGEEILCALNSGGFAKLLLFDPSNPSSHQFLDFGGTEYCKFSGGNGTAAFLMGNLTSFRQVVLLDLNKMHVTIMDEKNLIPNSGYISTPEPVNYASGNNRTSHALFYPPKNKDYTAPKEEKPPLIVMMHGGPTAAADPALSYRTQYWTSRGFAILDVNYTGSTGFGRPYREGLKGNWGIVDVEDCIAGCRFLIEKELIDPQRIVIRGGSAGGFTVLQALITSSIFAGGTCYYGVADLELLANETHKFEANYLNSLIGPYPDQKDLYLERSPIHHVDKIRTAVLFMHGRDDKVVPLNQTERMYEALKKAGVATELIIYEGEEHGFRKMESIVNSIESELFFYKKLFKRNLA